MTRVNLIPPELLTDEHLGAEYREVPRIFGLVQAAQEAGRTPSDYQIPPSYVLGKGHVTFFYNKLLWLKRRQQALIDECLKRGRAIQYNETSHLVKGLDKHWLGDWMPSVQDVRLNLSRINERLNPKKNDTMHLDALYLEVNEMVEDFQDLRTFDINKVNKRVINIARSEQAVKKYFEIINRVPYLTWESTVTAPSETSGVTLAIDAIYENIEKWKVFDKETKRILTEPSYGGLCYISSYTLSKVIPGSEIYIGPCSIESCGSDQWDIHAFVVKDGVIYEPTGILRDRYCGAPIADYDSYIEKTGWLAKAKEVPFDDSVVFVEEKDDSVV